MPTARKSTPYTEGVPNFSPDDLLSKWASGELSAPAEHDFQTAVSKTFGLRRNDQYIYHATASVTLAQVQHAVNCGAQSGLHAWYRDEAGNQLPPPPPADITAYTTLFASTTSTSRALTAQLANAKKDSLRLAIARHLLSHRLFPATLSIPKLKPQSPHPNPYLDFWTWSCHELEWGGPTPASASIQQSHHILPVFYHHFGCVCPSFEALETIRQLAAGRPVLELGSGGGYWTYMLRRMGVSVRAVDNGDSLWRTMWIGDTIKADGAAFLARENGAADTVLLLVYPQVTTDFTREVLRAYKGGTICVAGTQNANGFTGFADETVDEWLAREVPGFGKVVQTPLPSFAGKDEALFVFQRKADET